MDSVVLLKRGGFLLVAGGAVYFVPQLIQALGVEPLAGWMKTLVFVFTVLFGVLFHLANKLAELADLPGLSYRQQRVLEPAVRVKIARLWKVSAVMAGAALLAVTSGLVSSESSNAGYWLLYAALVIQAISMYFALFIPAWFEEVRRIRWEIREQEKIAKDREALLKKMADDAKESFKADANLDLANKPYQDDPQ